MFVGDLIDRGPEQLRTVDIVRRMVDDGHARVAMGNHELNAIAFHTPDPEHPGEFMRRHTQTNLGQHQRFLDEVGDRRAMHDELIAWFHTLPLWLDLGPMRVVHACWDDDAMAVVRPALDADHRLPTEHVVSATRKGTALYRAVETVLKGREHALPGDVSFLDKEGTLRREVRVAWWRSGRVPLRDAAVVSPDVRAKLPEIELELPNWDVTACPVFFGHYWFTGQPTPVAPNAACLDYSVARRGRLTAYRWDGEALSDRGFHQA